MPGGTLSIAMGNSAYGHNWFVTGKELNKTINSKNRRYWQKNTIFESFLLIYLMTTFGYLHEFYQFLGTIGRIFSRFSDIPIFPAIL